MTGPVLRSDDESIEHYKEGIRCVASVAAAHADRVDAEATFPTETFAALRSAGLLVPDPNIRAQAPLLTDAVAELARACGSSGLVFAMHLALVRTLDRHAPTILDHLVSEHPGGQLLIAGATSEKGTDGDIRRSLAAVESGGGQLGLAKAVPTASYSGQADVIVLTARRAPDATAEDQLLLVARRRECTIATTTGWQALGMRGTMSGGIDLRCTIDPAMVAAVPFAAIIGTMVASTHTLWAACWEGIAQSAADIARRATRGASGQDADLDAARRLRLSDIATKLSTLHAVVTDAARDLDRCAGAADAAPSAAAFNHVRLASSEIAVETVLACLTTTGIQGYLAPELSNGSLSRQIRDVLSSSVMVNTDRVRGATGWLALRRIVPDGITATHERAGQRDPPSRSG